MITHKEVFGNETYIILAYYATERGKAVVIGQHDTYEGALEQWRHVKDYKNANGENIFFGAEIYAVPEKPIPIDSPYWKYKKVGW